MAHQTRYAAGLVAFRTLNPETLNGFGAQGAGFRVQDLRFAVWGSGLKTRHDICLMPLDLTQRQFGLQGVWFEVYHRFFCESAPGTTSF